MVVYVYYVCRFFCAVKTDLGRIFVVFFCFILLSFKSGRLRSFQILGPSAKHFLDCTTPSLLFYCNRVFATVGNSYLHAVK